MVHGIPSKRKLREGDIISIDCGTVYEGFVGDSAFTMGVGEISPLAQSLIEVTKQALEVGIAEMVPGNHLGDIGAAIEEFVTKHGFTLRICIPGTAWVEKCMRIPWCLTLEGMERVFCCVKG